MEIQRRPSHARPVPPSRKPSMDFDFDDLTSMSGKHSAHTLVTAAESDSEAGDNASRKAGPNVRFQLAVRKHWVESHKMFSKEEREACWYTPDEKEKYTSKREKTVARMEAGKPEKRGRPYRGLYCWTEKGSTEFNAIINRTIDAVMDEQDEQWNQGLDDYDRIAYMSREVTRVSAEKALHTAYEDEQEAIAIRGTMFDDVNALTDDDSTVGMASLIAKKRRQRKSKRNAKGSDDDSSTGSEKKERRRRRREARQDPPGEKKEGLKKQPTRPRKNKVKALATQFEEQTKESKPKSTTKKVARKKTVKN